MHLLLAESVNPVAIELIPLVTTIVVFVVAFWVLKAKVWPKIAQGLDDRDRKIRDEIRAAEEAREQARAAQAEYEQSLATAKQEAAEMIATARSSAKAAAEELRQRNEAELVEMKQRATRDIETAKQRAIDEIRDAVTTSAIAAAEKILKREITSADQQNLVDEAIRELEPAS